MRRTAGVTHLTVFTRPAPCGGDCLYCPATPGMPKSYLPHAEITRMGLTYDAEVQARYWLKQAVERGVPASKIEVLVLGGSFLAHDEAYRRAFLAGIYRAVDGPPEDGVEDSLEALAARHAALAGRRIIGITIEARPEQVEEEALARLFAAGVTKVEIGVQSLDEEVLARNDRGHGAEEVARATERIRRAGLKTGYHLLLGMPFASAESDLASASTALRHPRFRPDHLKIYFCEMFRRELMKPRLAEHHDAGLWRPLSREDRLALLGRILPLVPSSTRISRIGRKSAPAELESERILVNREEAEARFGCRCVRCREPKPGETYRADEVEIVKEMFGTEIHLEARPRGRATCLGLLRLRGGRGEAIVRELHVYGIESAPGGQGPHQHRGLGSRLLASAEECARVLPGLRRIVVASGVGVRAYYEKRGYSLDGGGYLVKSEE